MKTFNFAIIASGLDPNAMDFVDRLFEAGCSDATVAFQKGVIVLEFEREARNFSHALASAISDVHRAGAHIEQIEPDHLVSLSEIAGRAGLTRAGISLYSKGARGAGFPAPVRRITTESPLWDWVEVARWLFHKRKINRETVVEAKLVREANRAIHAPEGFEQTIFAKKIQEELTRAA